MVLRQCKCGTSFPQYNSLDNKCGKCKIEASKRKKPSKLSRPKTTIKPYRRSNNHIKIYNQAFGVNKNDNRLCELSGSYGEDIHHIEARGMGGDPQGKKDRIENLMALTRTLHIKYGDVNKYKAYLFTKHKEHLLKNKVNFDVNYINERIEHFSSLYPVDEAN